MRKGAKDANLNTLINSRIRYPAAFAVDAFILSAPVLEENFESYSK